MIETKQRPPLAIGQIRKAVNTIRDIVGEMNSVATDYVMDGDGEFGERDTLQMRMLARAICDSIETAVHLVKTDRCDAFAIASYFEEARTNLREYNRLMRRHSIGGHIPGEKYRPYDKLYMELEWLVWASNRNHAGFDDRCHCVLKNKK